MNPRIRKLLAQRKRRVLRRLDKNKLGDCRRPMMTASNIHYEIADRSQATAHGGIGLMHLLTKKLGLDQEIDRNLHLFKMHLPYHESDHVLNIAYNLLAGGTCLEHLELLRTDEAYMNALGARRIPDPTTAGDFCRRFHAWHIARLQRTLNTIRQKVWKQQPDAFFDEAILDADGTMTETYGECKQGMDINFKGQWGYHPLVISLANTGEPLYIVNRRGNRPSHEQAGYYLDQAIAVCHQAGFRKVRLRGDTDFTQRDRLDSWDQKGVKFVFGIDATTQLYALAGELPANAWKTLDRPARYRVKTQPRQRPENFKQRVVEAREFKDIRLVKEEVAEFLYRPGKCQKAYRLVVVSKQLDVYQGQQRLFDDGRCFFYITNDHEKSAEEIVFEANGRCNQENLLQQLKSDVRSLSAPVDNLLSNWAYMVIASLAWSLKAWAALCLPEQGRWQDNRRAEKERLLKMDFSTFRNAMIHIPAQIMTTGRKIVYRLLNWNPWQPVFFRLLEQLTQPLRC